MLAAIWPNVQREWPFLVVAGCCFPSIGGPCPPPKEAAMLHKYSLPARWFRFFAGRSQHNTHSAPPPASASPAAAGRASQPRRPVPLPGTEDFWLALAACYLPESVRPLLEDGLRQSVRARACWGQTGTPWPDERPNEPPEWRRFGIYGEQLVPKPWLEMQRLLIKELKRTVHRSEEHTSELQSRENLVCRLLLEKK